jgi:hypothetical protein
VSRTVDLDTASVPGSRVWTVTSVSAIDALSV